jgi:hypothetical protein
MFSQCKKLLISVTPHQIVKFTFLNLVLFTTNGVFAQDGPGDLDKDGILDFADNCLEVANPGQQDSDGDGFGNICDGDLDNNGIVNSLDFSSFKKRLTTRDPNADLNSDGIVNSIDYSRFKRLLLKPVGPSGIPAEPTFIDAPPPASSVDVFRVEGDPKGNNAAIAVEFEGVSGLKPTLSFNFDGATVALNDTGIEPDAEKSDGVYSGYFKSNFEQQDKFSEDYQRRLQSTEGPRPKQYNGRDVSNEKAADLNLTLAAIGRELPIKSQFKLAKSVLPFDLVATLRIAHDPSRSLMVRHPDVVRDPARTFDPCDVDGDGNLGNVNGAWSFKTLMTNMANFPLTGITPQQFTHNWLNQWMANQAANGFVIPARTNIQNFFPGWNSAFPATLNMNLLPFRLLAIVNRIDLAKSSAYGAASPGEIRLVFGLVDVTSPSCASGNLGSTRQMTVIFEYGDVTNNCSTIKNRANQWVNLSSLVVGSPAYNAALQNITNNVTLAGAAPGKPNGSAINQVRTNEIALNFPWQLREFTIRGGSPNLRTDTIKQTPDPASFRIGSAVTANYMQQQNVAISCESHQVPLSFLGQNFLGSHTDYGFGTIWNAPAAVVPGFGFCVETPTSGIPTPTGTVRHKLSLNTCDDCHSGETNTTFTHISPTSFPAGLSGFLTGITVNDPGGEVVTRTFDDLDRRGQILEDLAVKSCFRFIPRPFDPIVRFPRIPPIFKFEPPNVDPSPVDFSVQQQFHTFVH